MLTLLTVCTYNIHAGRDALNRPSLPQITATLAQSEADLCLLQEVDKNLPRSGFADQAAVLGRALGARACFYGRLRFGTAAFGNATLSRLSIGRVQKVALPGGGEVRGALGVHLEREDIWVWNTHLGLREEWRAEQLSALEKALDDQPVVLVGGDFNAPLEEEAVGAFLRNTGLQILSADAPTFPAAAPAHRIDFLLGRGLFTSNAAAGVEARTTADPGSDHCLVWARVTTQPPLLPAPPAPRCAE